MTRLCNLSLSLVPVFCGQDCNLSLSLDLKSAYDKVQRQLLWSLLQRLGVHGHMLGAVQSLYHGSLLSMRVNGQCGHSQSPSIGLRQGCPLSATLFGIFIDGLHHHLQTRGPAAGVQIRHLKLTDLVYADDICLLAGSPQHLQALIDALVGYCATIGWSGGSCFHMQWASGGAG